MEQIEEFVDERHKGLCIYCAESISNQPINGDHVPSKCLLRDPLPEHLPEIEVHAECNRRFSLDEEYLSVFMTCVLAGSTDPDKIDNPRVARALRHSPKLQARIEGQKTVHKDSDGTTRLVWTPQHERVHQVVVKNARGHAFHEYGEPMLLPPTHVWAVPLAMLTSEQRAKFENVDLGSGWPEVGSRMMTRMLTGQDLEGSWVVVQDGVYRYAAVQQDTVLVRSILYEYLATEVCWGG